MPDIPIARRISDHSVKRQELLEQVIKELEAQYEKTTNKDRTIQLCLMLGREYEALARITEDVRYRKLASHYQGVAADLGYKAIEGQSKINQMMYETGWDD